MKILLLFTTLFAFIGLCQAAEPENTVNLRLVTYNVACGQWGTPQEIGKALSKEKPDIVFLNEVPTASEGKDVEDWTKLVAKELGLKHVYVGTISSANHKAPDWGDLTGNHGGKFKSIISRTPLIKTEDIATKGRGWSPASAIRVVTKVAGSEISLYSLHLPGTRVWDKSMHQSLAAEIMKRDATGNIMVAGDFNESTDGVVMKELTKQCKLTNVNKNRAIDHILYRFKPTATAKDVKIEWGPKEPEREKKPMRSNRRGHLSDHPWAAATLELKPEAK